MNVVVQFGKDKLELELADGTVAELQTALEARTGVFTRLQKLIFKGKVLSPTDSLPNGAKLMMMSSAGAAVPTAGQAALAAVEQQRRAEAAKRAGAAALAGAQNPGGAAQAQNQPGPSPLTSAMMSDRAATWQKTGIVGLRDVRLSGGFPLDAVRAAGAAVRVLDLHNCGLATLPEGLWAGLTSLRRVRLSENALTDEGVRWEELCGAARGVEALVLDRNGLTALPACISSLTSLQNQLASLPDSLGALPSLRVLDLSSNALPALPSGLAASTSLLEIHATSSKIIDIPEAFGAGLPALRTLNLDGNRVRRVPPAVLRGCTNLSLLSLYENPIVIEELRETEGYADYDKRRKAKVDKQLESRVAPNLNEGADFQRESWGGY